MALIVSIPDLCLPIYLSVLHSLRIRCKLATSLTICIISIRATVLKLCRLVRDEIGLSDELLLNSEKNITGVMALVK